MKSNTDIETFTAHLRGKLMWFPGRTVIVPASLSHFLDLDLSVETLSFYAIFFCLVGAGLFMLS